MSTADAVPTTNPSIELTRKGERAAIEGAPDRMTAVAEKRRLYIVAAREVERLLAFLDRLDGDPDLEDGADDEPSLGFTRCGAGVRPWDAGDDDREADDSESEASLGSPESVTTPLGASYDGWEPEGIRRTREGRQTHWAKGNTSDLEGDAEDDEDDGGGIGDGGGLCEQITGEPSLGATLGLNQVHAWRLDDEEWPLTDGEPPFASTAWEDGHGRHGKTRVATLGCEDDELGDETDRYGIADRGALDLWLHENGPADLTFDGSGIMLARDLLAVAGIGRHQVQRV
jgi:hypothetical protein